MANELHNYRKLYRKHELHKSGSPDDPFQLFSMWFKEVDASKEVEEVNTMTLSTIGVDGFPKSRIVLLKEYDGEGFVFYTNYFSEKGRAISNNPKVCLSFFWPGSERQVIIKGVAGKTSEENSIAYFKARPRASQLGAWASDQSKEVPSREYLENRLQTLEAQFKDKPVPKPPNWGGFKVFPEEFEFWQGRPGRLHDRIRYSKNEGLTWKKSRLAP
ncbi:MAG TPA: pyridoxamine 5'-phosphate oxidase [Salinimicrobium sp.]|nr:pyridoxamine 5'-phosphate oxidase [Salinimicrobium sp.]